MSNTTTEKKLHFERLFIKMQSRWLGSQEDCIKWCREKSGFTEKLQIELSVKELISKGIEPTPSKDYEDGLMDWADGEDPDQRYEAWLEQRAEAQAYEGPMPDDNQ